MRPVESVMLLALLLVLLLRLVEALRGVQPAGRRSLAAFLLMLAVAHWALEGTRWQFIPAYAVLVWLAVRAYGAYPRSMPSTGKRLARGAAYLLALVAVAFGGALGILLPVPVLPHPGGPYPVGTALFMLEQPDRPDPYAPVAGEMRRFPVQVWYPAGNTQGVTRVPWNAQSDIFVPAAARRIQMPGAQTFFSHLHHAMSNSYADAPPLIAEGPFPVIIYSHGWLGWRTVAINQVERLASEGYVVFAPDHTYGALATVFPDGEAVPNHGGAMPPREPADAWHRGIELLVDTYAGDVAHLLDRLAAIQHGEIDTPVAGLLNLAYTGVFGHSTGAGAVMEVTAFDPRVTACLALDPWVEPVSADVMATPLTVPFMSIRSEEWVEWDGENNRKLAGLFDSAQGPVWNLYLKDTEHRDFTVAPLLFPYAHRFGLSASGAGRRELQVTDDYIVAFFHRYLKGADTPWLDGPSAAFPEMVFAGVTERVEGG